MEVWELHFLLLLLLLVCMVVTIHGQVALVAIAPAASTTTLCLMRFQNTDAELRQLHSSIASICCSCSC